MDLKDPFIAALVAAFVTAAYIFMRAKRLDRMANDDVIHVLAHTEWAKHLDVINGIDTQQFL